MKPINLDSRLKLARPFVCFGLTSVFLFGFVLAPLWNSLPGLPLKVLGVSLSMATAIIIGWWGSADVSLFSLRDLLKLGAVFFVMVILNGKSLLLSLAWRGDEDFHTMYAKHFFEIIHAHKIYAAVTLGFAILFLLFKKLNVQTFTLLLLVALLAAFAGHNGHFESYDLIRYPLLLRYATAAMVWLFQAFSLTAYPELPYRVLPFISSAILVFLMFQSLPKSTLRSKLAVLVFFASVPIVRYYSSLNYLEMPAVLCMTLVLLNAKSLLEKPLTEILHQPSWVALVLVGFMKETVLPFVLVLLVGRFIFRIIPLIKNRLDWKIFTQEIFFFFAVGFPLFAYLKYRMFLGNARHYQPVLDNFFNQAFFKILLPSWWESFGLLLLLALVGFIYLSYHKKWSQVFVLGAICVADTLFHFLDGILYVGYSRFNLFLLPVFCVLGIYALGFLSEKYFKVFALVLLVGIVLNFIASPFNQDGTRKPFWGIYALDIGENDYPYREALSAVQKLNLGNRVRLTGNSYPYRMDFYLPPQDLPLDDHQFIKPEIFSAETEGRMIDSLLFDSKEKNFAAVLYHLTGNEIPKLQNYYGFNSMQTFKNQTHTLVLFTQ